MASQGAPPGRWPGWLRPLGRKRSGTAIQGQPSAGSTAPGAEPTPLSAPSRSPIRRFPLRTARIVSPRGAGYLRAAEKARGTTALLQRAAAAPLEFCVLVPGGSGCPVEHDRIVSGGRRCPPKQCRGVPGGNRCPLKQCRDVPRGSHCPVEHCRVVPEGSRRPLKLRRVAPGGNRCPVEQKGSIHQGEGGAGRQEGRAPGRSARSRGPAGSATGRAGGGGFPAEPLGRPGHDHPGVIPARNARQRRLAHPPRHVLDVAGIDRSRLDPHHRARMGLRYAISSDALPALRGFPGRLASPPIYNGMSPSASSRGDPLGEGVAQEEPSAPARLDIPKLPEAKLPEERPYEAHRYLQCPTRARDRTG